MRLFTIFQRKENPQIDICLESKCMTTAKRIVAMINNSVTMEQLGTVSRMIDLFEKMYDDTLPLRKFYLQKSFEIENVPTCIRLQ